MRKSSENQGGRQFVQSRRFFFAIPFTPSPISQARMYLGMRCFQKDPGMQFSLLS
jgi:hypothetical protein